MLVIQFAPGGVKRCILAWIVPAEAGLNSTQPPWDGGCVCMDALLLHVAYAFGILLCAVGGILAAKWMTKDPARVRNALSMCDMANCFAGGVLLGAGLTHLLSDAGEKLERSTLLLPSMRVRLPEGLCGVGFLLAFLLEKVWVVADDKDMALESKSVTGGLMLTVVLSVHSILAGMALGTFDTYSASLGVLLAIVAHKSAAAFSLAANVLPLHISNRYRWAMLAVFSLSTPVGVFLGGYIAGMLNQEYEDPFEGIVLALASGTFLEIAAFDVLRPQFDGQALPGQLTDVVYEECPIEAGCGASHIHEHTRDEHESVVVPLLTEENAHEHRWRHVTTRSAVSLRWRPTLVHPEHEGSCPLCPGESKSKRFKKFVIVILGYSLMFVLSFWV